jgi:hypothetical protein
MDADGRAVEHWEALISLDGFVVWRAAAFAWATADSRPSVTNVKVKPDPLAFACGGGKALGDDCVGVVHGAIRVLSKPWCGVLRSANLYESNPDLSPGCILPNGVLHSNHIAA